MAKISKPGRRGSPNLGDFHTYNPGLDNGLILSGRTLLSGIFTETVDTTSTAPYVVEKLTDLTSLEISLDNNFFIGSSEIGQRRSDSAISEFTATIGTTLNETLQFIDELQATVVQQPDYKYLDNGLILSDKTCQISPNYQLSSSSDSLAHVESITPIDLTLSTVGNFLTDYLLITDALTATVDAANADNATLSQAWDIEALPYEIQIISVAAAEIEVNEYPKRLIYQNLIESENSFYWFAKYSLDYSFIINTYGRGLLDGGSHAGICTDLSIVNSFTNDIFALESPDTVEFVATVVDSASINLYEASDDVSVIFETRKDTERPDTLEAYGNVYDKALWGDVYESSDVFDVEAIPDQTELDFIRYIIRATGELICYDNDIIVFIKILAKLQASIYRQIKTFPLLRDLDYCPEDFLVYFKPEIGLKLPYSSLVPLKETLRESKSFYSGKSTKRLFSYIGKLHRTSIDIDEPAKLIFRLSDNRTLISGLMNKSINEYSRLGRIRDGIVWSYFTYFIDINSYQNIENEDTFLDDIRLIHPAGTQFFLRAKYQYWQVSAPTAVAVDSYRESDFHLLESQVSLDNGFILDGEGVLDQLRAYVTTSDFYVTSVDQVEMLYSYRRFRYSSICKVTEVIVADPLNSQRELVSVSDVYLDNNLILSGYKSVSSNKKVVYTDVLDSPRYLGIWDEATDSYQLVWDGNPIVDDYITHESDLYNDRYGTFEDMPYSTLDEYVYKSKEKPNPQFNYYLYPLKIERREL